MSPQGWAGFTWEKPYSLGVVPNPPASEPNPDESLPPEDAEGTAVYYEEIPGEPLRPRLPFWKRIGGEGLVISVVLHGILLVIFAVWVIATITDTATTDPDTFATGSGGGAKGERAKIFEHKMQPKNAQNLARNANRITPKSATASVALPDLPTTSTPSLMTGMTGGGTSKGFGGGSGGGIGGGKGVGVGNSKNFVGLFGAKFGVNGLSGTFYDIKQTKDRKATDAEPYPAGMEPYREVIRSFLNSNWNPSKFERYYRAPDVLMMSQLFIPGRPANAAPLAFGVEKEVKPSRWLVHYKGTVRAPQAGTFRFVGSGDDWLLVRWNRKIGFDEGYETFEVKGGKYVDFSQVVDVQVPIVRAPGGRLFLKCGPWITVRKGDAIPVEILMGEGPGGVFDVYLAIEVAKPKKEKGAFVGEGSLKLFRTTNDPVPEEIQNPGRGLNIDMQAEGWVFEATKATTGR